VRDTMFKESGEDIELADEDGDCGFIEGWHCDVAFDFFVGGEEI